MTNDNKLIAEFMGYQVVDSPKVINGENFFEYLDKNGVYTYCESLLRYNDKWDWLMPVIAKIVEDYGEGWIFEEGYNLQVRYKAVVEFIKEHTMKEQIRGLIEYAKDPRHTEEEENYISDGQMLDIILEQLEKLIK